MNGSEVLENLRNGTFNDFLGRLEQIYDYIAFNAEQDKDNERLMNDLDKLISRMNLSCKEYQENLDEKLKRYNSSGSYSIDL